MYNNNSSKFKCPLCKNDHPVPKSKFFELNKFAMKILNIRLGKDFIRTNYSQSAESEKLLKEQIERIEKQRSEFKEDLTEKISKTEIKINNYASKMIEILSSGFTQNYLQDITNELNRGDERLRKEINSTKQSFKSSQFSPESKNIVSKCQSLERSLQIENEESIKPFDFKNDEKIYFKHFLDRVNFFSNLVCLSLENNANIIQSTVYALSENIIFYCVKEKTELKIKLHGIKASNNTLQELKLDEEYQLKYFRVDEKNFFAFFHGSKECCMVRFDMVLLQFAKSKTMTVKRELIFVSSAEIMLFSSKTDNDMIKIIDINYGLVESLGQCTDKTRPYYFKDKTFRILGANKQKVYISFRFR